MKYLSFINSAVTSLFTLWIIIFSAVAFYIPSPFAGLSGLIVPVLGVIMFGMGMTLRAGDFRRIMKRPRDVGVGVAAQYGIMPAAGGLVPGRHGL